MNIWEAKYNILVTGIKDEKAIEAAEKLIKIAVDIATSTPFSLDVVVYNILRLACHEQYKDISSTALAGGLRDLGKLTIKYMTMSEAFKCLNPGDIANGYLGDHHAYNLEMLPDGFFYHAMNSRQDPRIADLNVQMFECKWQVQKSEPVADI